MTALFLLHNNLPNIFLLPQISTIPQPTFPYLPHNIPLLFLLLIIILTILTLLTDTTLIALLIKRITRTVLFQALSLLTITVHKVILLLLDLGSVGFLHGFEVVVRSKGLALLTLLFLLCL